ncbi:hypothetical protein CI105_09355, partial [Candidatus Izimaplasma bacterium ZiA1]|uniref:hypothetical protein n=1 Tax=Candidatus Izimoplasma sp. ZiA1 TaxID=2024899 RepID=UPI000BC90D02
MLQTNNLIGRKDTIKKIRKLKQHKSRRIIIINGKSGVGKSSIIHSFSNNMGTLTYTNETFTDDVNRMNDELHKFATPKKRLSVNNFYEKFWFWIIIGIIGGGVMRIISINLYLELSVYIILSFLVTLLFFLNKKRYLLFIDCKINPQTLATVLKGKKITALIEYNSLEPLNERICQAYVGGLSLENMLIILDYNGIEIEKEYFTKLLEDNNSNFKKVLTIVRKHQVFKSELYRTFFQTNSLSLDIFILTLLLPLNEDNYIDYSSIKEVLSHYRSSDQIHFDDITLTISNIKLTLMELYQNFYVLDKKTDKYRLINQSTLKRFLITNTDINLMFLDFEISTILKNLDNYLMKGNSLRNIEVRALLNHLYDYNEM